jgi:hypothetical protein
VWVIKVANKWKALFHAIPWKRLAFVYFPEYRLKRITEYTTGQHRRELKDKFMLVDRAILIFIYEYARIGCSKYRLKEVFFK